MDVLLILVEQVIITVVLIGINNWWKSYSSKKGENLADIQDIGQITKNSETVKANIALLYAGRNAFAENAFEALKQTNDLLTEIHLYCWKKVAEFSQNEHYVWNAVDESDSSRGFHYYRVALHKLAMTQSLYLPVAAERALFDLADSAGLVSSMELAVMSHPDDKAITSSQATTYSGFIREIKTCRNEVLKAYAIEKHDLNEENNDE